MIPLRLLMAVFASVPAWAGQAATPAPAPAASGAPGIPTSVATTSMQNEQPSEAPYRLEAGDGIEIRFFFNQELNDRVEIRPDGQIAMPMVGQIRAAGLTVEELTNKLAASYKEIVKQPAITVQVRSYANRRFFVGGEVNRAGVFALGNQQTVLGAILEAGGMRLNAKKGEVVLIRRAADGKPTTQRVSLRASRNGAPEAASLTIQPYDVVLVSEAGIAKANRAMDQYVRQMIPMLLTGGFTYLFNGGVVK